MTISLRQITLSGSAVTLAMLLGACSAAPSAAPETAEDENVDKASSAAVVMQPTAIPNGQGTIIPAVPPTVQRDSACCTFDNGSEIWSETVGGCGLETPGSCCSNRAVGLGILSAWRVVSSRGERCDVTPPPRSPTPNCTGYLCQRPTQFGNAADSASNIFGVNHMWVMTKCTDPATGAVSSYEAGLGVTGQGVPGQPGANPDAPGSGTSWNDHGNPPQSEQPGAVCNALNNCDASCIQNSRPIGTPMGSFGPTTLGMSQCNQTAHDLLKSCGCYMGDCLEYSQYETVQGPEGPTTIYHRTPVCVKKALDVLML